MSYPEAFKKKNLVIITINQLHQQNRTESDSWKVLSNNF